MKKLGEFLKEAGVLDEIGLNKALTRQRQTGQRLGETLLELSLVNEDVLFEMLAKQLEIPIIAEAKLVLVDIKRETLDLISPQIAWEAQVLPLMIDASRRTLSVVTSEPNDPRTAANLKKATGIPAVKCYLAKRSALRKVLTKYYGPDPSTSTNGAARLPDPLEVDMQPVEIPVESELILGLDDEPTESGQPPVPPPRPPPPAGAPIGRVALAPAPERPAAITGDSTGTLRAQVASTQRLIKRVIVADPNRATAANVKKTLEQEGFIVEIAHTVDEILNLVKGKTWDLVVVKSSLAENIAELERRVRALFPMIEFRVVPSFATSLMGDPVPYTRLSDFMFEGFDLMLALIERGDNTTRLRAQTNSRYAKAVAQKLQLPRKSLDEVYLSAYLDALGDVIVRQRGGDPTDRATTRYLAIELFRAINPPYDVETVLGSIDERFDGSGPHAQRGEQIPIGARILAVVFGYNDAKGIPRDQLQRFLRDMSGKAFDPKIVEIFLGVLKIEAALGDVGGPTANLAGNILIVDKDVAHTSTLELRLTNEGYRVSVVGDGQAALEAARLNMPSLVISEIALPRMDGFNLCMTMKSDPRTQNVPFVFVSGKSDEFNSNKAMDMGADDFIAKPVNVEFLLKKLKQFLVKPKAVALAPTKGFSGRLSDFGIIELIQTLSLGMKTVKIELQHDEQGEAALYLEQGRIVAAESKTKTGEEAFYLIATWADAAFAIVANATTKEKNVAVSNDFLILESLRRMDEFAAGISQDGKEAIVKKKQ
jgi:response regulator RpfG family c-di-GMP phosphodiesterase